MRFEEKLKRQMLLSGFNQQRLARASSVSDSEISRILSGKSVNPGVENALKLAKAVGVSLDYLADDSCEDDTVSALPVPEPVPEPTRALPPGEGGPESMAEEDVLAAARELGVRQARRVLETACALGFETAMRRLLELKPVTEIDSHRERDRNGSMSSARAISGGDRRVSPG